MKSSASLGRFRMGAALLLLPALAAAAGEPAQAPPAKVYATATVRERLVASATAAVSVVDRETLDNADRALDALALVPGLFSLERARGGLATVQIRGGDPNFTRVLIDGVPVNDGTYQQGEVFDFEALPAAALERIEVVRGPLSSFYGPTGLAGVIQVFTRRGTAGRRGELRLAGGDAGAWRADAVAAAGGERADAFGLAGATEEGPQVARERFRLRQFLGRARVGLAGDLDLELAGRLAGWQADDYPEGSGGPVYGSGELRRGDHREAGASARLAFAGSDGRRQFFDLAYYRHGLDRESPAIFPLVPAAIEATRFTRGRAGWSAGRPLGDSAELSFGADLEQEAGDNTSRLLLPPYLGGPVSGDYRLTRTSGGLYGELLVRHGTLSCELGLRADFPQGSGNQLSPRLGLAWRPGDGATRIHASAGRAFKLPSFFALASPPALGGNPDLEPETSLGSDLGVEHRFAAGLELDLTFFAQRYQHLVDFDFATFRHLNRGLDDARGAELSLAWRHRQNLSAALGLTFLEVEEASGARLRHRPRWAGTAMLGWRPGAHLELAADLRAAAGSFDEQIPVPERGRVAGHALWGLAATWRPAADWRIFLRVDNLAGADYETQVGFPGPGRSWRAGVVLAPGPR